MGSISSYTPGSLYHAVSRLLYGQENMHKLLRLLTALEIGSFPQYYDPSDVQYVSLVGNAPIHLHFIFKL